MPEDVYKRQGQGTIINDPCPKCSGRGRVRKNRKITIKIPAGIDNGMQIPLRKQGEPGLRGGENGDLYIFVTVKPHKLFTRENYDLYCDVTVSFTQAALGGEIDVPTLNGMIKHNLPEGTQPGTVIRLRGQGIQNLRGAGKGDLYIKVLSLIHISHAARERAHGVLRAHRPGKQRA